MFADSFHLYELSLAEIWCFRLRDGSLMEITKVYPLDAVYDFPEDVPEDVILNIHVILWMIIIQIKIFLSETFMILVRAGKN